MDHRQLVRLFGPYSIILHRLFLCIATPKSYLEPKSVYSALMSMVAYCMISQIVGADGIKAVCWTFRLAYPKNDECF